MINTNRAFRIRLSAAFSILAAGWAFYLFGRGMDPLRLFWRVPPELRLQVSSADLVWAYLPSLLHAAAFMILFRAVCPSRRSFWQLWLLSTFGYELLQAFFPILGTFDLLDVSSIAILVPFAYATAHPLPAHGSGSRTLRFIAVSAAGLSSIATSGPRHSQRITHTVVCMQLAELRSSFAVEAPRALKQSGRIFLNGNLLMINEPFQGIHVYDNTVPEAPVAVAFLKIPGNTDIAMKDSYLYADSAVDLLTVRFDGSNATLVGRAENVLVARTPAEFSDEDFYVPEQQIQACEDSGGVVVGYEPREDGATYKRRIEENKND